MAPVSSLSSFSLDTTRFPDGPILVCLETIDDRGDSETRPYFLLIGNTTDYSSVVLELQTLCREKRYKEADALLWNRIVTRPPPVLLTETTAQEKENAIRVFSERICTAVETNTLRPSSYTSVRSALQKLFFLERYPIPVVPFTAGRILAILSAQECRTMEATRYYKQLLTRYPDLWDLPVMEECRNIVIWLENPSTMKSLLWKMKERVERAIQAEKDSSPHTLRYQLFLAVLENDLGNSRKSRETATPLTGQITDRIVVLRAQYQLAVIEKEEGNCKKARYLFEKFLKEKTDQLNDHALFQMGECWYKEREYRKALACYERIAQTYAPIPERPSALLQTGLCCLELGEYAKAREFLKMLIHEYPEYRNARQGMYLLGDVIYRDARQQHWGSNPLLELEELTVCLKTLIEKYPGTNEAEKSYSLISQAIREVTDTFNTRGQYDLARRTYAQLVGEEAVGLSDSTGPETDVKPVELIGEKNPNIQRYLNLADGLYVQRNYKEAIQLYRQILAESPRSSYSPWVQRSIGICYAGMADYATAVEELLKVIHRYPQSSWAPDALERIGIYCWQGLGEPEKAIDAYRKLIEKHPDDNLVPYAHFWLGTIYLQQEKTDLAKKEFLLVKQQWPMLELAERSIRQLTQLAHQQKKDSPKKSGTIKEAK